MTKEEAQTILRFLKIQSKDVENIECVIEALDVAIRSIDECIMRDIIRGEQSE